MSNKQSFDEEDLAIIKAYEKALAAGHCVDDARFIVQVEFDINNGSYITMLYDEYLKEK